MNIYKFFFFFLFRKQKKFFNKKSVSCTDSSSTCHVGVRTVFSSCFGLFHSFWVAVFTFFQSYTTSKLFLYISFPQRRLQSLWTVPESLLACIFFFFSSCKTHLAVWCLSLLLALGIGEGSDLFLFACWLEAKGNSVCFAWLYKLRSFCILAVLGMQRQGWEKARQKMLRWIWTLACKLLTATNEWYSCVGTLCGSAVK